MLSFAEPPRSVCILRLSAIGDACHVVPIVRTLQQAWPGTQLTWIIGKAEARLMSLIEGVEFIIVDKRADAAARRARHALLRGRSFDVLLHMQLALRASLLAHRVRAGIKLGFDRARAREMQWLFTNARIAARTRQHVLDSFFGFTESLGISQRVLRWDLPLPPAAQDYAARLIPDGQPTLIVSPCSSHPLRNWLPERYAAVAEHAAGALGMRVILAGGPSTLEREVGARIEKLCRLPVVNQIGKDTLPELLALLGRARALLTPDSGPAHMGTMAGTPVIGLYAATNPARSGPYLSGRWCVDAYPQAARTFRGVEPDELPWTHKIEEPGVMALIGVDQVTARLDELLGSAP
ncbi:MAG: glycosyltransferase family 9 protein [Proteobacteria bacterium]|nr:glycosyltransferase family 9 protein [Pseudomonadota bacterium]